MSRKKMMILRAASLFIDLVASLFAATVIFAILDRVVEFGPYPASSYGQVTGFLVFILVRFVSYFDHRLSLGNYSVGLCKEGALRYWSVRPELEEVRNHWILLLGSTQFLVAFEVSQNLFLASDILIFSCLLLIGLLACLGGTATLRCQQLAPMLSLTAQAAVNIYFLLLPMFQRSDSVRRLDDGEVDPDSQSYTFVFDVETRENLLTIDFYFHWDAVHLLLLAILFYVSRPRFRF